MCSRAHDVCASVHFHNGHGHFVCNTACATVCVQVVIVVDLSDIAELPEIDAALFRAMNAGGGEAASSSGGIDSLPSCFTVEVAEELVVTAYPTLRLRLSPLARHFAGIVFDIDSEGAHAYYNHRS